MPTATKPYRYQLPKKAIKSDCPECGHRKALSRYVDTQTGEALPDTYGRCDRESNCGYHHSPYHKGASGLSYAQEMNPRNQMTPIPKAWFRMAGKWKRNGAARQSVVEGFQDALIGATPEQAERIAAFIYDKPSNPTKVVDTPKPVYSIPDEVFTASLGRYEHNQFARLLMACFGAEIATLLLQRFFIGTSSRWPGACVFWYIDEKGRKRGGQIKLFDESFHTVKYKDSLGEIRSRTTWVHSAYARRCDEQKQPYPVWLSEYLDEKNEVEKSPCLFGLPQLLTAPIDQPVALVEAPKTAVICTHYFPDFVWMAVGALSYLKADRVAALKGRSIMLFPDLSADGSAFARWSRIADELNRRGFTISVSTLLEENATQEQRAKGYDLADFLLDSDKQQEPYKPIISVERIEVEVIPDPHIYPPAKGSTISVHSYRLPKLIEQYWQMFTRPPLWWNKIAAHKALLRCLEPEEETAPEIVTTLTEHTSGTILKPYESQLERLDVPTVDTYPAEWDEPSPPDATPTIRQQTFFEWQRSNLSPFSQLGLATLQTPACS
ncbi:DUF6371 domain-containing protein [Spirosoma areae]